MKHLLLSIAVFVGSIFSTAANTNVYSLTATITDPILPADNAFGYTMGAVGDDNIVITSYDRGDFRPGAYLFNSHGSFITTLTNLAPGKHNRPGLAVGSIGSSLVVLGASWSPGVDLSEDVGAVYLVQTNGAMLLAITNPAPAAGDSFGLSVAGGLSTFLVGAHLDDTGASNAGSAYLFATNGALVTTLTNPTPLANENFGAAMAYLGKDRVLVGAHGESSTVTNAGAVYLFNTNGNLLTTITNPLASSEAFGRAICVVGSDKILIGAPGYDHSESAGNSGAAYLFSTNGALLLTFTNPAPSFLNNFGLTVGVVDSEVIFVSAPDFWIESGSVHLFGTNGALLCTFKDPTPAQDDYYGLFTVALGSDRLFLSAQGDGAVYYFTKRPGAFDLPRLKLAKDNSSIRLSWPITAAPYRLFEASSLTAQNWMQVTNAVQTNAAEISVTVDVLGQRFYRLESQ